MGDGIILLSMAALLILAVISFFVNPQYEKGVWIAIVAASNALSAALGAKFGLAQPHASQGREQNDAETSSDKSVDDDPDPDSGDRFSRRVGFAPSGDDGD